MEKELINEIEKLLEIHSMAMLEFYNGRVFYIRDYWKYLDIGSAPRIQLCRGEKPNLHLSRGKYLYIQGTDHLKSLINESKQKTKTGRR